MLRLPLTSSFGGYGGLSHGTLAEQGARGGAEKSALSTGMQMGCECLLLVCWLHTFNHEAEYL